MAAVTVAEGSDAAGRTIGSLPVTVAAVTTTDGAVETVPATDRPLAPGDTVYAVTRPSALGEFHRAAASPEAEVTS